MCSSARSRRSSMRRSRRCTDRHRAVATARSRGPRSAARWWRCSRISRCIAAMRRRAAAVADAVRGARWRARRRRVADQPSSIGSRCSRTLGWATRRRRTGRDPVPAAECAARGKGGRGHRVLPVRRAAVAQRGGRRCAALQRDGGGVPRGVSRAARQFPDAMLATATHDHKRGEDVRARLAVISEIPDEWGTRGAALD